MLDRKKTNDIALYYPLSPTLAILLTKDSVKFPEQKRRVTLPEVKVYNQSIYSESNNQIYSSDEAYLRSLVEER
jgi:hypothetical protein